MSNKPDVSIAMGVYNCESTLARSIESILNQSYKDYEFIICDDGSSDESLAIMQKFAAKDRRIQLLINKHNMGLSATLNSCISIAKGKYIARMDADDISHSDRLEKQIAFMEKNPDYSLCGCSMELFDEKGIWGTRNYPEKPVKRDFLFGSPFAHPTIIFRKEAIKACSEYRTGKSVGRSEDYDLFMRMYALNMKGYNFKEYLFSYCETRQTFAKRKFKYALTESLVRYRGYVQLRLLLPFGLLYILKPLIIACIPHRLQISIRKKYYAKKSNSDLPKNFL